LNLIRRGIWGIKMGATTLEKRLKELDALTKTLKDKPELMDATEILSIDYKSLTTPFRILQTYLKVLVSVLPLVEQACKARPSEFTVNALTTLGNAIRTTITELDIYKNPEMIVDEKVVPHLQFHHDQVVKHVIEKLARAKTHILEEVAEEERKRVNTILITFLTDLGEDLKKTYTDTLEKLKTELISARGLA